MDVLLERQVQWDIKVGIVARGGELLVTPYLDDPDPSFERLDGPTQVVWRTPLVVAGVLPEGVVDVEVRNVDFHIGDGDEQPALDDSWFPLEWANVERELERTDRVLERPEVQRAAETPTATFPLGADGEVDAEAHLPAVVEIVRLFPAALAAAGLELADRFAASAAHFEGWGALDVIDGLASPELRAALEAHGEMPTE